MTLHLRLRRLPSAESPEPLPLPTRATAGASGFDLQAALRAPLAIAPGARVLVPTGFAYEIPPQWEAQVRARSGLAWRQGLTVLNGPGTIDADFRGEVQVLLVNLGDAEVTLRRGDRLAQLVLCPVPAVVLEEVETLSETGRGDGGFGHTGLGALDGGGGPRGPVG